MKNNDDTRDKTVMINSSMRCFTYGLISLLPGIGLPFAILSLWNGVRARSREKKYWNAAKPYRIWGDVFVMLAIIFWLLVAFLIAYSTIVGGSG